MRKTLVRFGQATRLRIVIIVLFLRGCVALIFGVAAFLWPTNAGTPLCHLGAA